MINNFKKGFTLIEVLVSVAIFTVISVAIINIMMVSVRNQNRILQNQKLLDESSYAIEYMTKSLTMAKLDKDGLCTGAANTSFGISADPSITFLAYDTSTSTDDLPVYLCRRFILSGNALQEEWSSGATNDFSSSSLSPITSSAVKVNKITFGLTGDVTNRQPKVTVMMNMESNTNESNNPQVTIQTSISQRYLNITE